VDYSISIIGAGSYGTALAISIARNAKKVMLWGHNKDKIALMQSQGCNEQFLPGIKFPETLTLTSSLQEAISCSRIILVVVPSVAFSSVLIEIKPFLTKEHCLAWATKGLERASGRLLSDVAQEILGKDIPLAAISGPTFAKELAMGLPTAISAAGTNEAFTDELCQLIHSSKNFRVYRNDDLIGLQIGGSVKNVIAIGAGISDGLGFGANARTALITRGLVELQRLGVAMGAKSTTFMGMAGLGDLVLTCTDNQSRNRRFGLALGKGATIKEAIDSIGQVVEGYDNTQEVHILANKYNVDMPICNEIYNVLFENKSAKDATISLLSRTQKTE